MSEFRQLYQAGSVKRWHTRQTIKEQDLAAHSWGVAMIVNVIWPGNAELMRAALVHDLHESEAGDIPYPFKKNTPAVFDAYASQEDSFNKKHGIEYNLGAEFKHALKWADMFELLMWSKREINLGNQNMWQTLGVAMRALEAMGHPNERARNLYMEETNGLIPNTFSTREG